MKEIKRFKTLSLVSERIFIEAHIAYKVKGKTESKSHETLVDAVNDNLNICKPTVY